MFFFFAISILGPIGAVFQHFSVFYVSFGMFAYVSGCFAARSHSARFPLCFYCKYRIALAAFGMPVWTAMLLSKGWETVFDSPGTAEKVAFTATLIYEVVFSLIIRQKVFDNRYYMRGAPCEVKTRVFACHWQFLSSSKNARWDQCTPAFLLTCWWSCKSKFLNFHWFLIYKV